MDSASIANFFVPLGYLMDQTIADELFGFGALVLIGVGGLAISLHTLIKHWNDPPPAADCAGGKRTSPLCCCSCARITATRND